MIRIIILLSMSHIFIACVSKSEYELLEEEHTELKKEHEKLLDNYNRLLEEKLKHQNQQSKVPFISEKDALEYVKDFFEFYNKNETYRNVELRRVNDNTFNVSLETNCSDCPGKNNEFFWNH